MVAGNSSPSASHDREVDALLNRLHSGCRPLELEEQVSGAGAAVRDACNRLRNLSPPDEVHAELGRALARSYVESLRVVSSSLAGRSKDADGRNFQHAIERGERIIQSLCCGEGTAAAAKSSSRGESTVRDNYASAACSFFGVLRSFFSSNASGDTSVKAFIRGQWQSWCVRCEELVIESDGVSSKCYGGGVYVLHACLNSYGHVCHLGNHDAEPTASPDGGDGGVAKVYESLAHHSSRKYLVRTSVAHAFGYVKTPKTMVGGATVGLVEKLSPLFHSCVLRARKEHASTLYHAERQLLLQEILRGCSTLLHGATAAGDASSSRGVILSEVAGMVQYLSVSLTSYLNQGIRSSFSKLEFEGHTNERSKVFELGYDWLRGTCDLMAVLAPSMKDDSVLSDSLATSLREIMSTILPQFTPSSADNIATYEMGSVYSSVASCNRSVPPNKAPLMASSAAALRLGSLALSLQDSSEVDQIIDLIISAFEQRGGPSGDKCGGMFVGCILAALGCVFRCRLACSSIASRLYALGETMLTGNRRGELQEEEGSHLMDIIACSLRDEESVQPMMDMISSSISDTDPPTDLLNHWRRRPLSLSDQCSGLLLGLSMLHLSSHSPQTIETAGALGSLQSFLLCYPRLASRAVPAIVDVARACLQQSSSALTLAACVEFLASPCIVSDPHGAHLAWTFLSSLASDEAPTAARSTAIRVLPIMCGNNKRLLRRAMDIIGKSMVAHDPSIRISATAALSDLAEQDLLRDVEQIIFSVQSRLNDEEPAVVFYALEVLRHLVINEELEFDLVIKVLTKRLGLDISDVDVVVGLDSLILEGLVPLLGQGGLEEDDDDESEDGECDDGPVVTPQTVKAVTLLVELALSPRLSIKSSSTKDVDANCLRIQAKIYGSLAGYTSEVLGLDPESIRSWDGFDLPATDSEEYSEVHRFLSLKEIALAGIDSGTDLSTRKIFADEDFQVSRDLLDSAQALGKTILRFEEDVHGSFLFRGSQSSSGRVSSDKTKAERQPRASKSVLSSLPAASSIQEMFESDPRSASATALLYSIGSSGSTHLDAEGILTQVSEALSDLENESIDPIYQTAQLCSLLRSMSLVWRAIQGVGDGSNEELLDHVLVQMQELSETFGDFGYVAIAAFVLAVDDTQLVAKTTQIQTTIIENQGSGIYESEDTGLLCLGLVGAALCRNADARVSTFVDTIEQSLLKHEESRQAFVSAIFGLGIICKNLMSDNINGTDPSDTWRRDLARRVIGILLTAFNTCLSEENDTLIGLAEAVKSGEVECDLPRLRNLSIQDGFVPKMRAVLIGLGNCFPLLGSMAKNLLKCVLIIVDKLPWGSGKGFVLHAAYKSAIESGVMDQNDLSEAITTTSSYVQDSSGRGDGDALLSLASLCRLSTENSQEVELIAEKCEAVLVNRDAQTDGDDKLMTILAASAAIGELPGLVSFSPTIHTAARKNQVASFVKALEKTASDDAGELKYRDAATAALGMLCAMSSAVDQTRKKNASKNEKKFDITQAKDGSLMQGILKEVEKAYSLLAAAEAGDGSSRLAAVQKLCAFFSTMEPVAMPGSFSRVIESTLNDSFSVESELKAVSIKLLGAQLESRRRIGFDGRGFVDLSTRFAKMPPEGLRERLGSHATTIMMASLPDLLYQIPTSVAEEVARNLWAICLYELKSGNTESVVEFLLGLKSIISSVNEKIGEKPSSSRSISPALQRTLQQFITAEAFADLCTDAVPSPRTPTENVWSGYLHCLKAAPSATSDAGGLSSDPTETSIFGMAVCASMMPKRYNRRVEAWIARQRIDLSESNRRTLLMSTLVMAPQVHDEKEMKDSILALFDVMLVMGVDTMCIHIMAAKCAFWWNSREVHQLHHIDQSAQRVSSMSSFFVKRNLSFDVHNWATAAIERLFDAFIADLPATLAALCHTWKMSADVANRAARVLTASIDTVDNRERRWLSCMRGIAQSLKGGEI